MIPANLQRFPDLHPALDSQSAVAEANRCLYCFDAPCTVACPTHIDVPRFIKKIATGNLRGSAATIFEANVLGLSCSRVCPVDVLCEGSCVLHRYNQKPIEIGLLQRYAMEHRGNVQPKAADTVIALKVACIGAGPASLACAAELRKHGAAVTIFDNRPLPGGLNTYGVAEYKLRPPDALAEVEMIRAMGVEFRCAEVGTTVPLDQLERDFDYVFMGVGLGAMDRLHIPGEDLPHVTDALRFIERYKTDPSFSVPTRVIVIGGGNTAIDAANAAVRLGAAEVRLFYRRTEHEMPAFDFEYEHAKVEGVRFHFQEQPIAIEPEGVRFLQTRMTDPDAQGRRRPEPIPGTEHLVPTDMVIPALGQSRLMQGITVTDRTTGRANKPRYFAGGDCVNGGREVVDAVADGKRSAIAILAERSRDREGAVDATRSFDAASTPASRATPTQDPNHG